MCPVRSAKSSIGSTSRRPGWTVWPAPGHSRFRCRASPRCVARVRCRPGARKVMAPRGAEKYPALGWREPCPSMPVRPTGGAPHGGAQDVTRTRGHGTALPNECSWDAPLGRLTMYDGGWHMSSRKLTKRCPCCLRRFGNAPTIWRHLFKQHIKSRSRAAAARAAQSGREHALPVHAEPRNSGGNV
jgi:hypothetical protein